MKLFKYLLIIIISLQLKAQNNLQIKGKVFDFDGKPLSYVHILAVGAKKGTLTNQEGEFSLKINNKNCGDLLQFSHVGFKTKKVRLDCKNDYLTINLEVESTLLDDVSVNALTAKQIVEKSIQQLKINYQIDTINYEVFLRNTQEHDKAPVLLQEYVFNIYSIEGTKNDFYIKKVRSKSFTKDGNRDERKNKTSTIPSTEAHLMLKYIPDFLERKKMKRFTYAFGEDIFYQGDTLYVVQVNPIKKNYIKAGEIWINSEDFGIAYVKNLSTDEFWDEKAILNRTRHSYYTKVDSWWILSHGYYTFTEKVQKTNSSIDHKFITVVTSIQDKSGLNENEKMNDSYWVKTKKFYQSFDDDFWEDYNYIPLEQRFKEALEKTNR